MFHLLMFLTMLKQNLLKLDKHLKKLKKHLNSILKIKSQGLPNQNSNRRGDLFVHLVVEIPKKLSKQQKSLLDEFRKSD